MNVEEQHNKMKWKNNNRHFILLGIFSAQHECVDFIQAHIHIISW